MVGLESLDNVLRECERAFNVRLCHGLDVLRGDVEKWLPDGVCGIVEGDADGLALIMSTDLGISGIDIRGVVGGYRERGSSPTDNVDLVRESLERVGTASDEGDSVAFLS